MPEVKAFVSKCNLIPLSPTSPQSTYNVAHHGKWFCFDTIWKCGLKWPHIQYHSPPCKNGSALTPLRLLLTSLAFCLFFWLFFFTMVDSCWLSSCKTRPVSAVGRHHDLPLHVDVQKSCKPIFLYILNDGLALSLSQMKAEVSVPSHGWVGVSSQSVLHFLARPLTVWMANRLNAFKRIPYTFPTQGGEKTCANKLT